MALANITHLQHEAKDGAGGQALTGELGSQIAWS